MTKDASVEKLLAKDEIRDIIVAYCRGIDRGDHELVRTAFHEDATLDYGVFSGSAAMFIDYAVEALATMGPTAHNITNCTIVVSGEEAESESYAVCVHTRVPRDGGLIDWISGVRYLDRFARREGEWRIVARRVVFDWEQNLPVTENRPEGAQPIGRRDSSDFVYAFLPRLMRSGTNSR